MTHFSTLALCVAASLFVSSSAFCEKNQLQDSAKAVEYFENELNFTTNPYSVKSVVDGKTENVTIVDVRSEKDFKKGHIPGAINLPYDKYNSFEGSETEYPGLKKDGFNYVYCYTGTCNLAQKAAKKFATLKYPVKEMLGGFQGWKSSKYPIEKK